MKPIRFRECTLAVSDGKPMFTYLDESISLDVYDNEGMNRMRRVTFLQNRNQSRMRKLYRMTALTERKVVFETFNYAAVYVDSVRLCNLTTGKYSNFMPLNS